MKGVSALMVTGIADGLIHWQIFFILCSALELTQAASNFAGFCVAAAFSFYVNMLYTFDSRTSVGVYLLFIGVMGAFSFAVGTFADARNLPGLLTVGVFTLVHLLAGYCFFRFVLFRGHQS
ncbi:GtrA family protein [Pseudomonas sp. HMWF006]|uniref:GtrA family protein n=1 Tax=Pseudomonas sp. HMWF006 TaxID=2056843 RepID=UPI000D4F59B8|nr:GtrA family protein [Pseudomonas sp. HMWF006]PTT02745.1 polysaccharide synthesis protein GtrA [Pseudomonas sp. HMWF006]PTT59681.1 polysaccharide synthesis protein GtrA [Pseudomonas sp. HMWF007]